MNQKLRELLIKYEKENKYADVEFVLETYNILCSVYGDIVSNVGFKELGEPGISDLSTGSIFVDLDFIKKSLLEDGYDQKFNIYLVNIYVLLVMLHEFNHFRQAQKLINVLDSDDYLDKLFVKSFLFFGSNNLELINQYNGTEYKSLDDVAVIYDLYHDCFAAERLAHLEAYDKILEIITPMTSTIGGVYLWFKCNYNDYLIREYSIDDDCVESPIFKLLAGLYDYEFLGMEIDLDEEEEFDDFFDLENPEEDEKTLDNQIFSQELIDQYKFIDRIKYGLPITKEEYISIVKTADFINACLINSCSSKNNKVKIRKKDINNY